MKTVDPLVNEFGPVLSARCLLCKENKDIGEFIREEENLFRKAGEPEKRTIKALVCHPCLAIMRQERA